MVGLDNNYLSHEVLIIKKHHIKFFFFGVVEDVFFTKKCGDDLFRTLFTYYHKVVLGAGVSRVEAHINIKSTRPY